MVWDFGGILRRHGGKCEVAWDFGGILLWREGGFYHETVAKCEFFSRKCEIPKLIEEAEIFFSEFEVAKRKTAAEIHKMGDSPP